MLKYEKDKEKKCFKQMDTKGKIEHIKEYYKWHIIGTIFALFVVGSLLNHWVFNPPKKPSCEIVITSAYTVQDKVDLLKQKLTKALPKYFTDKQEIMINTVMFGNKKIDSQQAMFAQQKLMAMISAKEIDIIISDLDSINAYAKQGAFMNLENIFSKDELKKLSYDKIKVKVNDEIADGEEQYKQPHIYALDVSDNDELSNLVYGDEVGMAILVNTEHLEAAKDIFKHLLIKD